MATGSLGTLSIDVISNIAGMVSDLGRAQQESAKAAREFQRQWTEATNAASESFRKLAEIVGIGLSLDWMKEFVSKAYEGAEAIERLAASTGISTQAL